MNIKLCLSVAETYLNECDLDSSSPRQDATVLMAYVLKITYEEVLEQGERNLSKSELTEFIDCTARRGRKEPVAYIRGYRYFMQRKFLVNSTVMVPNTITEQLVEQALSVLSDASNDTIIVDVGTGSGAIAVSIALTVSHPVVATDVSEEAVALAVENAVALGCRDKIKFRTGHLIDPVIAELNDSSQKYEDLVICANLPYLPEDEWDAMDPVLKSHEPGLSRRGGVEGLSLYRGLFTSISKSREQLPTNVTVVTELTPSQAQPLLEYVGDLFPSCVMDRFSGAYGIVDILTFRL